MLQPLTPLIKKFRDQYPSLNGPVFNREDPCGLCGSFRCAFLAKADYWDLQQVNLVKCLDCDLIQVDPRLTDETVRSGCIALYRYQHQGESTKSRKRGFFRAFRKGVALGVSLKLRGIRPRRVLEVGSGDGYFLKGLQYVFPEARYACLDVVKEILEATSIVHKFESLHASVEEFKTSPGEKFDLIIARDILEHVSEPGRVLQNLTSALEIGGHLFFITPNGRQDSWQLFSRWKRDQTPGELLINHVNYFDPMGLEKKLNSLSMDLKAYYVYDMKQFFRGAGWKILEAHMARPSVQRSAAKVIESTPSLDTTFREAIDIQPIPKAFTNPLLRPFLLFYCWLKHTAVVRVAPATGVGEEIFCLSQKRD